MRPRIPSQGDDITDHTTQKEQQDVLMRLPDFIQANMQRILDDAVDFAITQAPEGAQLNHKRLRNDISATVMPRASPIADRIGVAAVGSTVNSSASLTC